MKNVDKYLFYFGIIIYRRLMQSKIYERKRKTKQQQNQVLIKSTELRLKNLIHQLKTITEKSAFQSVPKYITKIQKK